MFGLKMPVMLKCCAASLAVALLSSSPSHALTIDFSFTNTVGNTAGTVTGEIDGLVDNAFSQATDVIILSAPAGLGLTTPLDVLGTPPGTLTLVQANDFLVSNGVIESGSLVFSTNYQPPAFTVNWQFCMAISQPGYCGASSGAYLLSGNGSEVESNVSPTFVSATPLPAALPLFAGGLGMVGFLARRKKQKALAAA